MVSEWFLKTRMDARCVRLSEPYVHRFFRGNMYHFAGSDADLVVDFGMGLRPLAPVLELTPGKPVLALATHCHVDHVGSMHEFGYRLGHEIEAADYAGMPESRTLADFFRAQDGAVTQLPAPDWSVDTYRIAAAPLSRILSEGGTVDVGDEIFDVLHLPGHSPGSIGLLGRRDGCFFSGDAIYEGQLVDDVPGSDKKAYRETMSRIRDLSVAKAYGGHNGPLTQSRMREIAQSYLDRG